ncbi:MAG TPA: glycoside hydrolase family 16 protein [Opitutales bacterium]|nr:glycoside hydrolase family 16 protein [Opitutales bacterium]
MPMHHPRAFLAALTTIVPALCSPAATLVWSDEFEGSFGYPDPAKWTYETGGDGWGNSELQYYTNRRDASANAFIWQGSLIVQARRESFGGSAYTSARLNSAASWKYGRFVIRAKVPSGAGTWPAIWMLPTENVYGSWPGSGEIDIMEHLGKDSGRIHTSLHTGAQNHMLGNSRSTNFLVGDAASAFHEYRIDWTAAGIWFYVDDVQKYYTPNESTQGAADASAFWPFDQSFHLLLNLAMGGWGGAIDDSVLPQNFEIDYVRVYSLDGADGVASRYGNVDATGWTDHPVFGPVYVRFDPWLWSDKLQTWMYVETPPAEGGSWAYIFK